MLAQSTASSATEPQIIEGLPGHQQVVAVVLAILMLAVVIELVRKRKLREEYSILWILTAIGLLALSLEHDLLTFFQHAVGAVLPTSALFFGGLLFLMLVSLQYSVRLSKLTARNKTLCQKIALLERDVGDLREEVRSRAPEHESDADTTPAAPDTTLGAATAPTRSRQTKTEAS